MIYQLVTYPRTASTYLTSINHAYNIKRNLSVENVCEFFLNRYVLKEDWYYLDIKRDWKVVDKTNIADKLLFLKQNKIKDNHFSLKVIPDTIESCYYDDLLCYLNDYKLLTIRRNPYNMFISYMYQIKTEWKQTHNANTPIINSLKITEYDVEDYLQRLSINREFIKSCNIHYTFNYEKLEDEIPNFFGITNTLMKIYPMNIDYLSLLSCNSRNIKEMFYDKLASIK